MALHTAAPSCVSHTRNCIKIHTHMYTCKRWALPSNHLRFKPTKRMLLSTLTATYVPPYMGQIVLEEPPGQAPGSRCREHPCHQRSCRGAERSSPESSSLSRCPAPESWGDTGKQEGKAETICSSGTKGVHGIRTHAEGVLVQLF